jgi:hypothetical protein
MSTRIRIIQYCNTFQLSEAVALRPFVMHRMNHLIAPTAPAALTAWQQGRSDLAGECTQLIGDGRLSLDVERGKWAPASDPPDEIGCGPG